MEFTGPPDWFAEGSLARPWGVTAIPLTYEPAVSDPSELTIVREDRPDRSDVVRCYLQAEPARELPRLQGIPIVIVAAEASYHAAYDHCTSKYLRQAGVANTFIRLEDRGIRGNGHMVMLETNSLRVARLFHNRIQQHIPGVAPSVVAR